jgi:hypothetical protein
MKVSKLCGQEAGSIPAGRTPELPACLHWKWAPRNGKALTHRLEKSFVPGAAFGFGCTLREHETPRTEVR